jgi:hypothetical protein
VSIAYSPDSCKSNRNTLLKAHLWLPNQPNIAFFNRLPHSPIRSNFGQFGRAVPLRTHALPKTRD